MTSARISFALLLAAVLASRADAQCILANPSFEILGSGGAVFGGWNQFGSIGSVSTSSHGARAARVSGPNTGGWDVSGFWQDQDSAPGEQWAVQGMVSHPSSKPLLQQCSAIVNVEWRDAGGGLISYESYPVADAATPTDSYAEFTILSTPAPAGTVRARLLVAVLQNPGAPSPDVYFDQLSFFGTSSPTIDELQWNDFPGGRTLSFGGQIWRVKGTGYYGPGPNIFSDSSSLVWVDGSGHLHLTLRKIGSNWYSTEIATEQALGYGDYIVSTIGPLDLLDPRAVLGIFLWEYGPCWDPAYFWWNAFNEADIEYSRWGNVNSDIGQFVAQPYDYPGNIHRFDTFFGASEEVSHAMRWLPDRLEFRVWRGSATQESSSPLIEAWTYTGPHVPRPDQPRLHLNLWKLEGTPAADQEIVFSDFRFVPEGGPTPAPVAQPTAFRPAGALLPAWPNPFNPSTNVRFELWRDDEVRLDVYDLAGRRVRGLVQARYPAGSHALRWDGRDDRGRALASGSYLIQLRGSDYVQSQLVTLLK